MEIKFYSTHCPKCLILEKKLKQKNISYTEINDVNEIRKTGYLAVPLLEVDGKIMEFSEANNWINEQEER